MVLGGSDPGPENGLPWRHPGQGQTDKAGATRRQTPSQGQSDNSRFWRRLLVQPPHHHPQTLLDEPGCEADLHAILSHLTCCTNTCVPWGPARCRAPSRRLGSAGAKCEVAGGGAGHLGSERQSFWVTLTTAFLWTPHSEARIDGLGDKLPAPTGGLVSSELA